MLIGHMLIKIFAILKINNNNNNNSNNNNNNHSKNRKNNFYTNTGSAHATQSKSK